eukprot:5850609-Pleurochrysis_carterae.AAC.4
MADKRKNRWSRSDDKSHALAGQRAWEKTDSTELTGRRQRVNSGGVACPMRSRTTASTSLAASSRRSSCARNAKHTVVAGVTSKAPTATGDGAAQRQAELHV